MWLHLSNQFFKPVFRTQKFYLGRLQILNLSNNAKFLNSREKRLRYVISHDPIPSLII